MYLTKLLLRDFGKFHNEEIVLKPGLNVIHGGKKSGKSTIASFIKGMLFGIPKEEEKKESEYDRCKPEGSSYFSGTAYLKKDGTNYLLDRTFLESGKKLSVLDVNSGRELSLKEANTITGTLLETDKNTYRDTMYIGAPKRGAAAELESYLSSMILTGASDIDLNKALDHLKAEKEKHKSRALSHKVEELSEKIEEYDDVDSGLAENKKAMKELTEKFSMEAQRRKRVARQLVENEDGTVSYKDDETIEKEIEAFKEKSEDDIDVDLEETKEKPLTDRMPVILMAGVLVVLAVSVIVRMLQFDSEIRKLFVIFTIILVIITIIDGLKRKGFFTTDEIETPSDDDFNKVLEEIQEENDEREEKEFDMTFAKEYQEKKQKLTEERDKLLDRKAARDKLKAEQAMVFKKKAELDAEVKSIKLAISTIEAISRSFMTKAENDIVPYLSENISIMTDGLFVGISSDPENGLIAVGKGENIPVSKVSSDMAAKIYTAIRLSIAKHFINEKLPLIIDDSLRFSNRRDTEAFLSVLSTIDTEQIVIFTSEDLISGLLDEMKVSYNYIDL